MPIDPSKLAAIKQRHQRATQGPYFSQDSECFWQLFGGPGFGMIQILKAPKKGTPYQEYWPNEADADFLTHSWEDIETLLQVVEEEEERSKTLEDDSLTSSKTAVEVSPPEEISSYHLSLGDSGDGPIGYCARVLAHSKEEAITLLKQWMEERNWELEGVADGEGAVANETGTDLGVEYFTIYLNPTAITAIDIDEVNDPLTGEERSRE